MKKTIFLVFVIIVILAVAAVAQENIEKKKIEYLISSVENLKGAKFIRNSTEHDCMEAAKHLRLKREKGGNHIQTADDFIRLCASQSHTTGKPYMIKFADGNIIPAEIFLRQN